MNNKLKYFICTIVLVGSLMSCQRVLLDPIPETSITDGSAFDNAARISNQVTSLYSALKAGQLYGGRLIMNGDAKGEDFISNDPNLVTGYDTWLLNPTPGGNNVVGMWAAGYSCINQCNIFLEGMDAKGSAVVGATLAGNYKAEARLIRALVYYNLLQFYARPFADGAGSKLGLPLRLTAIKGGGSSDLARSTVAQVYAQIIADLDFAEANLPLTNTNAVTRTTRAQKNAAISLKTRVYLSMQDYPKVITEANKIVPIAAPFVATSGAAHALQSDIINVFKTPYTTLESILSVPFTTTAGDLPGTQNGLQSYFVPIGSTQGIFSINSTTGIWTNTGWKATDRRKTGLTVNALTRNWVTKYPTSAPADYTIIIRWAEVLLNLAEARVRSTNTIDVQAVALLNAIRNRSDATTIFTVASFANATELIDAIMIERRIELLGEGFRNGDLMRMLQTIPAKGVAPAMAPNGDGYIWPVSINEKQLNKLWVD